MTNQTTAEILRKAKAHISTPEMWHKGSLFSGPGRETCAACAYGAILIATGTHVVPYRKAQAQLDAAVSLVSGCSWRRCAAAYNDDPSTTHADMMALFDVAIDMAEKDAE